MVSCHSCGEPREVDSQFCPWCFALPAPAVREPVAVAAAPVPAPSPVAPPAPAAYTPPNPFERRLSFDRGVPSVVELPLPPSRRVFDGVSWGLVVGVVALVFVVLAGGLAVALRPSGVDTAEAVVDASLAMSTDDEVKAALADVSAAQGAYFKAKGTYSSVPKALRAAAAKAPIRKGMSPDAAGAVYVDVPVNGAEGEPTYYLAARRPGGEGCLYLKGVPDGTTEAANAECVSNFAADFGPSPQERRAQGMLPAAADIGPGWVPADHESQDSDAWMGVETSTCLGTPARRPAGTSKLIRFENRLAGVDMAAAVWPTEAAAQQDAAQIDNPKFAACFAEDLRGAFFGEPMPGLDGASITVVQRGAISPERPDVRRARMTFDMAVTEGGTVTLWVDAVLATKGRVEVVMVVTDVRQPDDATTLRWVDAMLARGQ